MSPETPCVIDACFHDWRTVKGRKMLQLVFEIPIEKQGEVLTLLGHPEPSGSKWCMIALKAPATKPTEGGTPRPKRKFEELSLPEQCAIRCDDARFARYLEDIWHPAFEENEGDIARTVRAILRVKSRAELSTNHSAANLWRTVERSFQGWLTDQEYGESAR